MNPPLPAPVDDALSTLTHDEIRTFYFTSGQSTHVELIEALFRGDRERALLIYNQYQQRLLQFMQNHE